MNVIKTSIDLTKTIKNAARFKEIISVFAKNGFDEFIVKSGLHSFIPNFVLPKAKVQQLLEESSPETDWSKSFALRLRKSFEELGPTFIKLGQLLSSREDMFDANFIFEMRKLLDQAPGIKFEDAIQVIEKSLKRPSGEVFRSIDQTPIGTASIGVVYRGELFSGEKVVIKVRRPEIEKMIATDISILLFMIEKIEKSSKEFRYLGISRIIKDFATTIHRELDFNIELLNAERLKTSISKLDSDGFFYFPIMYKEYSSDSMIVMEYLDGVPFSRTEEIRKYKSQLEQTFLKGIHVFTDSLLIDGFFHADLHGGNFFLLKNGKIGIIDFGLVGTLGKKGRRNLVAILYFLLMFNYENLVYEFLDVAEYEQIPDVDVLVADLRDALAPYVGLSFKQMNFPRMVSSVIKTLTSHQIYLPREWFTVFRALITLDGVGRSLQLDFDLFSLMDENLKGGYKKLFTTEDLIDETIWGARDLVTTVKTLPHHLKWFLRDFTKKGYAIQVRQTGHEKEFRAIAYSVGFLAYAVLCGIFFIAGVFFIENPSQLHLKNIPVLTYLLWIFSMFLFYKGSLLVKKIKF